MVIIRSIRSGGTSSAGVVDVVQPALVACTLYQPAWTSHWKNPAASVVDGLSRFAGDMMSLWSGTAVELPPSVSERSRVTVAPWIGRPHWSATTPDGSM